MSAPIGKRPSESVEDYLKAIYEIEEAHGRVSTSALAARLALAPPSVTAMLRRLGEQQPAMVAYRRHRGVSLTEAGRRRALEVIRHHRLIETFLHRVLKFDWDEVHAEAERLEHYISERFEDRIAELLGDPEYDPHGAPIPAKDGRMPGARYLPLSALPAGARGAVVRINRGPEGLREYLASLGIVPGVELAIEAHAPFGGPCHVCVQAAGAPPAAHAIGAAAAAHIVIDAGAARA